MILVSMIFTYHNFEMWTNEKYNRLEKTGKMKKTEKNGKCGKGKKQDTKNWYDLSWHDLHIP